MNDIQLLKDPSAIDLKAHGVIEAHAGTGKTYTIEKMVLRILKECTRNKKPIHVREILLVTYTEKAAGELRVRLREGLEKTLREEKLSKSVHQHLTHCLNNMHEAPIGTIHAICLRFLQNFPFESGVSFRTETVDDHQGLERTLREFLRRDLYETSPLLPEVLEWFAAEKVDLTGKFWEPILKLAANNLNPDFSQILTPIKEATLQERLHKKQKLTEEIQDLETLFHTELQDYITAFTELIEHPLFQKQNDPERLEAIRNALNFLNKEALNPKPNAEQIRTLFKVKGSTDQKVKDILTKGNAKKIKGTGAAFLQAKEKLENSLYYEKIQEFKEFFEESQPLVKTLIAQRLAQLWRQQKEATGKLSFEDILILMQRASENPLFITEFQKRISFGMIDEFQDTSPVQWEIFKNLFLKNPHPDLKLFLVGDPKQSIYSFQGADIQTYTRARNHLLHLGARYYGLIQNYRSNPEVIHGYNEILSPRKSELDWFLSEQIKYPGTTGSSGDCVAQVPPREMPKEYLPFKTPLHPAPKNIQVMLLKGKRDQQLKEMARQSVQVIRTLIGQKFSLMEGPHTKEVLLDYHHFAVISESRKNGNFFLDAFQKEGIPASPYKLEGLFQSQMAREFRQVLLSIHGDPQDLSTHRSTLFTHFFNVLPQALQDEIQHPLEKKLQLYLENWRTLSAQKKWGQLMHQIFTDTRVFETLLGVPKGPRHLSDLREIRDYCLECLVRKNLSLKEVIERLQLLDQKKLHEGKDQNLLSLETENSSVKVLTMHASKGLEFPVVFVVPSTGVKKNDQIYTWVGEDEKKNPRQFSTILSKETLAHFSPIQLRAEEKQQAHWMLSTTAKDLEKPEGTLKKASDLSDLHRASLQKKQERRRLLYVALTRPQLALFTPLFVKDYDPADIQANHWQRLLGASPNQEQDLSPHLLAIFKNHPEHIELFNPELWPGKKSNPPKAEHSPKEFSAPPKIAIEKKFAQLQLLKRTVRQTSYTQLAHSEDLDRHFDKSEEIEIEASKHVFTAENHTKNRLIPGGAQSGNALHLLLEECLKEPDLTWATPEGTLPLKIAQEIEAQFPQASPETFEAVARILKCSLGASWDLSSLGFDGAFQIKNLPLKDRKAELEFNFKMGSHWLHGYIDAVFKWQGKYFVLDWKSNQLPAWNFAEMQKSFSASHYEIQAHLYNFALHQFLQSTLPNYNPEIHLGGAVYVYLRAYEFDTALYDFQPLLQKANPSADLKFLEDLLNEHS